MKPSLSVNSCLCRRPQPVAAVLKRSMHVKQRLTSLQLPQRTEHIVTSACAAVTQADRPSSPESQPGFRMTAQLQQVGQQTAQIQDQQLFLAKAWNFLVGASGVLLVPYIPLFLQSRGMSSAQIGLLAALRPWLAAPVGMTVSALADKHKAHTKLLLVSATLGITLRSLLPLAGGGVLLMVLLLAGELTGAPTGVLGDATVLSNCKDPSDYGKQRQWGSIGFGLLSIPAGCVIQHMGISAAFLIYAIASVPLLIIGSKMQYQYADTAAVSDGSQSSRHSTDQIAVYAAEASQATPLLDTQMTPSSVVKADVPCSVQDLLMQPAVLLFLWRCLLSGFGMGVMGSYTFLYLKGLGAPETLMGMALMASVCTEVPAFMFQGTISKHVSTTTLLNIALAATALRLAAYAALPRVGTVWAVLPVELLHGITFGIFFSTTTVYSSKLAPPRLSATMQGMFQSTYAGIGAGLGGLVGGLLMDKLGGQGLFAVAAAFVAVGCVVGLIAERAVAVLQQTQSTGVTRLKVE